MSSPLNLDIELQKINLDAPTEKIHGEGTLQGREMQIIEIESDLKRYCKVAVGVIGTTALMTTAYFATQRLESLIVGGKRKDVSYDHSITHIALILSLVIWRQ
jgi:hypothetical protein